MPGLAVDPTCQRLTRTLPSAPAFPRDAVHVVAFSLDGETDNLWTLLNDVERTRAEAFAFERDRQHYVAAHARLRLVLAHCLGGATGEIAIGVAPRGKPHLLNPAIDLRFNLSHSGGLALVALAAGREVGVDVERERPIECMELARRFFAPAEVDALERLPPAARLAAFFRCWTRKEAFVKAHGDGLHYPLDRFEVSLTDDDSEPVVHGPHRANEAGSETGHETTPRWRIKGFDIPGHAAAVAAAGTGWRLIRHE